MVAVGLLVTAVIQEMAKPRTERTWSGRVLGVVPYNFNPPTWERVRAAYWNPDDPRLFTDRVLGLGWAINLHRAAVMFSRRLDGLTNGQTRPISLRRSARD